MQRRLLDGAERIVNVKRCAEHFPGIRVSVACLACLVAAAGVAAEGLCRLHPSIRPYDELSEAEKQKDRNTVAAASGHDR
jgi:hypothetical protein